MTAAHEVDLPSPCLVPTSWLSQKYGPGTIVARWRNRVAVSFDGHLEHLTVARHVFLPVAAEGKSGFRENVERLSLITLPVAVPDPTAIADGVLPVEAVEVVVVVTPVIPEVAPPIPIVPCYDEYRVRRCVDGVAQEW